MHRNRRRSPPPRYVPYSPLGRTVNQNSPFQTSPPYKVMLPRPDYSHSPWNPHNQMLRQTGGAHRPPYHPPFPRFPTPCELGMGLRGKNRKVRFSSSRGGFSQVRGGNNTTGKSSRGGVENHKTAEVKNWSNTEHKPKYSPAVNGTDRPRPPPPPPLGHSALSGSGKSATSSPVQTKNISQYKTPTSPEEEKLRLAIISAVKELLRGKKLDKKMFKFVCKHCSLNIFSILSEKKDISKPEKMIHQRMAKIKKLVDEECERVLQSEKALTEEKSENDVLREKLKSEPPTTDNLAELR